VIRDGASQVRMRVETVASSLGGPVIESHAYGLDFPALLMTGQALGADMALLSELLPLVEGHVLTAWRKED